MSRTPRVTGAELIGALAKAGFSVLRVKGSHHFLRHEDASARSAIWKLTASKVEENRVTVQDYANRKAEACPWSLYILGERKKGRTALSARSVSDRGGWVGWGQSHPSLFARGDERWCTGEMAQRGA